MPGKKGQQATKPTSVDFDTERRLKGRIKRKKLSDYDGRFKEPKFVREKYLAICEDRGGEEYLSEIQRIQIEDYAFLELHCAQIRDAAYRGEEINWGRFAYIVTTKNNLGKSIGKDRVSKPVQTIQDYLNGKGDE